MSEGISPERRPRWAAFVIAAGLAVLAVVILWDAAGLKQDGGYAGVGPADVPRWIAIGLGGLSLWSLIEAFRSGPSEREAQNIAPVLWIVGGLAVAAAGFSVWFFGFFRRKKQ